MAAMRVDAMQIAPKVYEYLISVRARIQSLMAFVSGDAEKKKYGAYLE